MKEDSFKHIPVLFTEVMDALALENGHVVVDATAGGGGHLEAICQKVMPQGKVYAFDRDIRAHAIDAAGGVAQKYPNTVTMVHAPFSQISFELTQLGVHSVDRLLCDLGVSSYQLDTGDRGFSLKHDGYIDMRMDVSQGETAFELIKRLPEKELADVIYQFGEERNSRRIAKALKHELVKDSTLALAQIVEKACGGRRGKIHPATKTFQALRIAVNDELGELQTLLDSLSQVLKPGGRAVFISFHSLEDRIIKNYFRNLVKNPTDTYRWKLVYKKAVQAKYEESRENRRARSAKLRAIEYQS